MSQDPIVRLRRLLGETWSPAWRVSEAIEKACDEIERLQLSRAPEDGGITQALVAMARQAAFEECAATHAPADSGANRG
mgnify:CR=1 FL=1